tara:strand:- start:1005 stop:1745 length:741 start_codon:yes stop_codon:yes gene_type:complete
MKQPQSVIIAGSTGLIGSFLVDLTLKNEQISSVISVSRHALKKSFNSNINSQLTEIVDPHLHISAHLVESIKPNIGFIALGSTKEKAGNKHALRDIDVLLVVQVAKAMKDIGVKAIYIVSSIGASTSALSHYLRCKGEMEAEVEKIGFERIVFMQPGPLSGQREEPRSDEQLLQRVMKLIAPIMKGKLLNYKPIEAQLVAKSMIHLALQNDISEILNPDDVSSKKVTHQKVTRVSSQAMFALKPHL